eukprot:1160491-Pelagomonas_calceolata.AAC.1
MPAAGLTNAGCRCWWSRTSMTLTTLVTGDCACVAASLGLCDPSLFIPTFVVARLHRASTQHSTFWPSEMHNSACLSSCTPERLGTTSTPQAVQQQATCHSPGLSHKKKPCG